MERMCFTFDIYEGKEAEYKKRHDEIWPELKSLLKDHGIREYRIYLDEESHFLFSVMTLENMSTVNNLSNNPIMKKWWAFMKDIMETNIDDSPVSFPLEKVFFME
jgi:L-rhamnose mutarotase